MKQQTNDAGKQIVMDSESCQLVPYKCPAGIWTVGYGHTDAFGYVEELAKQGKRINQHQAEELLEFDLHQAEEIVDRAVLVPLNSNQFSALVSFVFNVGPGRADTAAKTGKDGFVTL